MTSRFWASLMLGAVRRTYSHPDSIIRIHCSTDPGVSLVYTVVMDCNSTGLSPPSGTSPILTSMVLRLLYRMILLQYCRMEATFCFSSSDLKPKINLLDI